MYPQTQERDRERTVKRTLRGFHSEPLTTSALNGQRYGIDQGVMNRLTNLGMNVRKNISDGYKTGSAPAPSSFSTNHSHSHSHSQSQHFLTHTQTLSLARETLSEQQLMENARKLKPWKSGGLWGREVGCMSDVGFHDHIEEEEKEDQGQGEGDDGMIFEDQSRSLGSTSSWPNSSFLSVSPLLDGTTETRPTYNQQPQSLSKLELPTRNLKRRDRETHLESDTDQDDDLVQTDTEEDDQNSIKMMTDIPTASHPHPHPHPRRRIPPSKFFTSSQNARQALGNHNSHNNNNNNNNNSNLSSTSTRPTRKLPARSSTALPLNVPVISNRIGSKEVPIDLDLDVDMNMNVDQARVMEGGLSAWVGRTDF